MSKQAVTEEECEQRMNPLKQDIGQIKTALIGHDMRGGIVADVAVLKQEVAEVGKTLKELQKSNGPITVRNGHQRLARREKYLFYGSIVSAITLITIELFKYIPQLLNR